MEEWQQQLALSAGVLAGVLLIRWVLLHFAIDLIKTAKWRYLARKIVSYLAYLIVFLTLLTIWIEEFSSAATFLGLVSAGLAIALRDPIVNFFGWIYIMFSRPFGMGDRVEIDDKKGDVLDINFFEFTILEIGAWVDAHQSTGRIIHIPNGKIFTHPLTNYNQGFQHIWHEIPVTITMDSNWEKAKEVLLEIENLRVKEQVKTARSEISYGERKYNIRYNKLTPTVYTTVKDYGIRLTLRFLCNPRNIRYTEQAIWEEILREFATMQDVHFAYPAQRIFLRDDTARPGRQRDEEG